MGYLSTLLLNKEWHKEDSNRHANVDEVNEAQEISSLHKDNFEILKNSDNSRTGTYFLE